MHIHALIHSLLKSGMLWHYAAILLDETYQRHCCSSFRLAAEIFRSGIDTCVIDEIQHGLIDICSVTGSP